MIIGIVVSLGRGPKRRVLGAWRSWSTTPLSQ